MRRSLLGLLVCLPVLHAANGLVDPTAATPPIAKPKPFARTIHGETLNDPYFWLRGKTNRAVISHLKAENAYTARVMKPTAALQKQLFKEIRSHWPRISFLSSRAPPLLARRLSPTRLKQSCSSTGRRRSSA